jgi:HEAT repeat protein
MPRLPANRDFDGWVHLLAKSQRRRLAKNHLLLSGPDAVPAIRRGLQSDNPVIRRSCVGLLDNLVDEASLPDLVRALDDDDQMVRRRALHALSCDPCKQNECRPGDDLFVGKAIGILQSDSDPDVRAAAIDALGKVAVRRPDATAALVGAAEHDPRPELRSMTRQRVRVSATAR